MATQVFINRFGAMSLTKKNDSVKTGQIHRLQGSGSFEQEIELAEFNEMTAEKMNFEWAMKCQQSPYSNRMTTICYIDNIKSL